MKPYFDIVEFAVTGRYAKLTQLVDCAVVVHVAHMSVCVLGNR